MKENKLVSIMEKDLEYYTKQYEEYSKKYRDNNNNPKARQFYWNKLVTPSKIRLILESYLKTIRKEKLC